MIFSVFLIAAFAVTPTLSFTNGSLVPAYICSPRPDGLPKAFSQLLPYMRKNGKTVAFDSKPGDNFNNATRLNATTANPLGNSAYILANFHNAANRLTAIQQGINVTTASGGPIIAGQPNRLILNSQIAGVELVGALLHAENAQGERIGSFTDQGTPQIFYPFAGCGLNKQGKISGVIQSMSVAKNGTYSQLFFDAPFDALGNITLAGLSVTNSGFGVWSYSFQVVPPTVTNVIKGSWRLQDHARIVRRTY